MTRRRQCDRAATTFQGQEEEAGGGRGMGRGRGMGGDWGMVMSGKGNGCEGWRRSGDLGA